jgi:hypothetical protein
MFQVEEAHNFRRTNLAIYGLLGALVLLALIAVVSSDDRRQASGPITTVPIADHGAEASPKPGEATIPPPTTIVAPSGEAAPIGDLDGWDQVFVDDFETDAPVGSFSRTYGETWDVYPDGTKDTAGQNEGGIGRYYPSKVVSVEGGVLNKHLHSSGGVANVAALLPKATQGQLYGRYSVRFRADQVPGYKMAWLLWPTSERWPDHGEVDFPEGNLDETLYGASIYSEPWVGSHQSDRFESGVGFDGWNTATTEWLPGKVSFYLNGEHLGTSTHKTPQTSMKWVLQTETCIGGCQPQPGASGDVEIDWVAAWKPA